MKWEDRFATVDAGAFVIIQPREGKHDRGEVSGVLSGLHRFRRIGRAVVVEKDLYPFVRAAIMVAFEKAERRKRKESFDALDGFLCLQQELGHATATNFFLPFQGFLSPSHKEG